MNSVYIIGSPGSGKTTLMHELTRGWMGVQMNSPVPHIVYEEHTLLGTVAQLGRLRESFAGTDALAMNIQPKAVSWVRSKPYDWLLGEGDRLANRDFLRACEASGRLFLFVILLSREEEKRRRDQRGSNQDDTWVRGRVTKTTNLMDIPHFALDGMQEPAMLVKQIRAVLDPYTEEYES